MRAIRADERSRFRAIPWAAAAALIAIVGAASWFAGQRSGANAVIDDFVVRSDWVLPSARAEDERQRIVLHLASDDPAEMERSLDQAELILAGFEYNGNAPEVELIANGQGLTLFRNDVTPFAERIGALQRDYPSLRLYACARTIERLALQGVLDGQTAAKGVVEVRFPRSIPETAVRVQLRDHKIANKLARLTQSPGRQPRDLQHFEPQTHCTSP